MPAPESQSPQMAQSPRPLHELLGQVFREHRRQDHLTLATLQQHWAELVGPGFAGRTWPSRLQQGLLWITAPDSSWAYQLQFLKQELLGAIRTGLPAFPVSDLRFKVGTLPASAAPTEGTTRSDSDSTAAPQATAAPPEDPASVGRGPNGPAPSAAEQAAAEAPAHGSDAVPIAPELLRAADTIADPTLRAAFLRALDKQARRQEGKG